MKMAEINCPICNRPNDASAERCWFCQAELPGDPSAAPSEPKDDWLDSFRSNAEPIAEENQNLPAENEPPQGDVPDWLARIRMREQEEHQREIGNEPASDGAESSDVPDWLRDIQDGGPAAQNDAIEEAVKPTSSSSEGEPQEEDWLKTLASFQPDQTPRDEANPSEPVEQSGPSEPAVIQPNPEPSEASDADC
jgi:hypothetical protein